MSFVMHRPPGAAPGNFARAIRIAIASLPLLLGASAIVALLVMDPGAVLDSPHPLFAFDFAFGTLAGACAAVLAASAFMRRGRLSFLFAGTAALIWSLTTLLPVLASWPEVAGPPRNAPATIHNIGAWLVSLAFLAAIVSAMRRVHVPERRRFALLLAALALAASCMGAIHWLALNGWFQPFISQASDGTALRLVVLISGACIFLLSAALVPQQRMSTRRFHFWFVMAALLFAEGQVATAFLSAPTLVLAWVGRALQWLGVLYMVIALGFAQSRDDRMRDPSPVLRDERLWPILTVALVITAAVVRALFLQTLGDSNPFVTFFIAVLLAAMYGGFKAGLVATFVSAILADFLWIEPKYTFYIGRDADLASMIVFAVTGVFICAMAEALRRANQRAQAAEIEAAARRARAAEDELKLSAAKLKRLLESNIIGIAFADTDRVIEANEAFLRMLGYDASEMSGGALDWRMLTPPEWNDADESARAMLFASGSCPAYRKEFLRKDGTRMPALVGAALLEGSSKYVCFVQDLTDVTRAEDQLREADRRKDEFLATLAHELRNPMAPIRTAVEILRRTDDAARRGKMLEMMDRQVRHMVRLIDDLLDVSRISRGKLQLQLQPLDLIPCIEHAIEASHGAIHKRGQRLEVSLPPAPVPVQGDPVRLTQIVSNLLLNASKYSGDGTPITLSVEVRGRVVVILVQDRGIGLEPDDLRSIFQLFAQVAPRSTARDGGLGIGLHLVKQLVEMHGGTVGAHSEGAGKGSTFEVWLPLDAAAAAPADQPVLDLSVARPGSR